MRVDPLTGRTARILLRPGAPAHSQPLPLAARPDLTPFSQPPSFCPFCADRLEQVTGTFEPSVSAEPRIRRGVSAVVPNTLAYSQFSSVGIIDVSRHFVDLDGLTPRLLADLLRGLTAYTRGVHHHRPMWHSINANYLPPAGSSVVHPHAQSAHDDIGTTAQRELVEASHRWAGESSFWDELVAAEAGGPRWVGRQGRVSVLTPWAPLGPHEMWAVVHGARDLVELTDADCADLGACLSGALAAYQRIGLASFTWALYGGGPTPTPRYAVLLRLVSRATPTPYYRSEVTYFERLHAEAVVDHTPEQIAELLRRYLPDT